MNVIVSPKPPTDVLIAKIESFPAEMIREIAELEILVYGQSPDEIEQRIEEWRERIAKWNPADTLAFGVRKKGQLVGFACVQRSRCDQDEWWLLNAIVHPTHRRQGIGTALAETRIAFAKERGSTVIRSAARIDNLPSRAYFRSLGFLIEGEWIPEGSEQAFEFYLLPLRGGIPVPSSTR